MTTATVNDYVRRSATQAFLLDVDGIASNAIFSRVRES